EEDGVELSKGQYQRLAIARLLANEDSNVWILDEPTAFLDPIAEIETYRHIFDLEGDRLVFFISHRLGFAKHADRIVVTEDGRIVEDGSHSELIARENSVYKKMFESQKEWYS
ncbi:MAG: ATP-binding cassette domain-containing protein, partial [Clostridia bacterium]|nr:ATP-binding cassette domain-containing protein [Clostridia bacterium]